MGTKTDIYLQLIFFYILNLNVFFKQNQQKYNNRISLIQLSSFLSYLFDALFVIPRSQFELVFYFTYYYYIYSSKSLNLSFSNAHNFITQFQSKSISSLFLLFSFKFHQSCLSTLSSQYSISFSISILTIFFFLVHLFNYCGIISINLVTFIFHIVTNTILSRISSFILVFYLLIKSNQPLIQYFSFEIIMKKFVIFIAKLFVTKVGAVEAIDYAFASLFGLSKVKINFFQLCFFSMSIKQIRNCILQIIFSLKESGFVALTISDQSEMKIGNCYDCYSYCLSYYCHFLNNGNLFDFHSFNCCSYLSLIVMSRQFTVLLINFYFFKLILIDFQRERKLFLSIQKPCFKIQLSLYLFKIKQNENQMIYFSKKYYQNKQITGLFQNFNKNSVYNLMKASQNFFQIIKLQNKTPIIMSQNAQPLQIVKQLYHIYPDIEGQLCSRHSTLFGKLRTTFNKLYDSTYFLNIFKDMEPSHYVIVKGTCQFVQQQFTQLKLSMALQNGIIILISKTYPTSQIFVNSNHFDQQIILSENGQLLQGLNPWSDQMTKVLKDSSCNLLAQQRYGGIMYIHANIPQNSFKYKQTFCMAMYIANLVINDNLKNFTKQQIVDKMSKLGFMGSKQDLQRQFFGYKNRKFNLTLPDLLSVKDKSLNSMNMQYANNISTPSNQSQINMNSTEKQKQMDIEYPQERVTKQFPSSKRLSYSQTYRNQIIQKSHLLLDMNKDEKFLFCKLDLAKQDVNYEFCRRKQIQIRKNQLLKQLYESNKISGLFDLFHHQQINICQFQFKSQYQRTFAPKSMEQLEYQDDDYILKESNKFLQILLHEINLISQFSNQNITLEKLIENLWEINSQYLKLHSQQVVQLVQDMKQRLQIKGCMVINQNFLLIVVNKNKFTQLLCQVKEKMNKGYLKSKSLFKIQDQEEMILQRWANDDKGIGQKIFTSVPASGVGIFDPSQAIWFG